jgi:hypothetical protein
VLGAIANLIANFNPLNDWLYPKLLDRFGHATARRVCSAIAILAMLTIVPPIALGLWVYNCVLDLRSTSAGAGCFQYVTTCPACFTARSTGSTRRTTTREHACELGDDRRRRREPPTSDPATSGISLENVNLNPADEESQAKEEAVVRAFWKAYNEARAYDKPARRSSPSTAATRAARRMRAGPSPRTSSLR